MKDLAILGASGHGKVVAEVAELNGWCVTFFDDAFPDITQVAHWKVVGRSERLIANLHQFDGCMVAVGDNRIRLQKQSYLQSHGLECIVLIHPTATVSSYARLGKGTVVMSSAVINPFARVGECAIINTGATIDHDCILAESVHVSPGASLAGGVSVGALSWIGIGASVIQGVTIGPRAIVGAGAVVVTDIGADSKVVGVPAKEIG
jgi:sugar O-acyltransferase (sialic acid O-acetyltransferase NeuD family)